MSKAAWVDRAAGGLSRRDPSALIDDLLAIAGAAFEDACTKHPETWSDGYFVNQPSSLSSWWQREYWARLLELEPRLNSNELWELTEAVWAQEPQKVRDPRAMADYVMGVSLPPMKPQDSADG